MRVTRHCAHCQQAFVGISRMQRHCKPACVVNACRARKRAGVRSRPISERDRVLLALRNGYNTAKGIAQHLNISDRTATTHLRAIATCIPHPPPQRAVWILKEPARPHMSGFIAGTFATSPPPLP